jgi:hypothetical protein
MQPSFLPRITRHAGTLGIIIAGLGATAALACDSSRGTDPCTPIVNGVVAYNPGMVLVVRDANGGAQAFGDTAITYAGPDSTISIGSDTLRMYAGFQAPGTYSVRVKRKFYQDALVSNVHVASDACGGPVSTTVPVTLSLLPGAPALRSISIVGSPFFGGPFKQIQLTARFDADASVPHWTIWRLSDTTAARIDINGLMTSKCLLKARAADTVFAISAVDTAVRARLPFTVASVPTCFMAD